MKPCFTGLSMGRCRMEVLVKQSFIAQVAKRELRDQGYRGTAPQPLDLVGAAPRRDEPASC